MEIGLVGGEEDGVVGEINEKLYTTADDALGTVEAVGLGEQGRYLLAATFGNVHGVYKPGNVVLRPAVLKEHPGRGRREVRQGQAVRLRLPRRLRLGARGDRRGAGYGVVKMNIDTDTQYAFTRPVAGHMFSNYDGVLKVDGEVGNKKAYDPRVWGKAAEAGMAARVVRRLRGPAVGGQAHELTRGPAGARTARAGPQACRRHVPGARPRHRHRPGVGPTPGACPRRSGRWTHGSREPARRTRPRPILPDDPEAARALAAGGRPGRGGGAEYPASCAAWAALADARWRRATRSPPTPTPGPATTAAWTRCAGPAGRGTARCRGSTSRTGASCAPCTRSAAAAAAIGEEDEAERCRTSCADSSAAAAAALGSA